MRYGKGAQKGSDGASDDDVLKMFLKPLVNVPDHVRDFDASRSGRECHIGPKYRSERKHERRDKELVLPPEVYT